MILVTSDEITVDFFAILIDIRLRRPQFVTPAFVISSVCSNIFSHELHDVNTRKKVTET